MKQIDKTILPVILVLLLLLAGVILFGQLLPIKVQCNFPASSEEISPYGSLEFTFSRQVDKEKAEQLLQTKPEIQGRWIWIDNKHTQWYALEPLPSGQEVTFQFPSGTAGKNGGKIKQSYTWTARVRTPRILAIKTLENGKELFSYDINENPAETQLSSTQGRVFDYDVSPDGERIIFSAENDSKGMDLWIVNRDGSGQELFLDCGTERCSTPAWSPDMQEIAYSRESPESGNEMSRGFNRIWIMAVNSGQTVPLFSDPLISGSEPIWSPDGNWLSIWISSSERIQVVNRKTGQAFLLETANGDTGSWSADSQSLYFPNMISGNAGFRYVVLQADIHTQLIKIIIGSNVEGEGLSYYRPVSSPLGGWVVVKAQVNTNIPGSQLMMINITTNEEVLISDDVSLIPSYCSWTPAGEYLVYQTLRLGDEVTEAKIWYWGKFTQETRMVLQGAGSPQWLP